MHCDGLHRTNGLAVSQFALAPSSFDENLIVGGVEVAPLQRKALLGPKTSCSVNECKSPLQLRLRLVEFMQNSHHLFRADNFRFVIRLRLAAHTAELW